MKTCIFIAMGLMSGIFLRAQEPVQWSYKAKKTGANLYEIRITAQLDPGWSIYSQETPRGGPQATSIGFSSHPLVTQKGTVLEIGLRQEKFEELFEVDVLYYTDRVEFVQTVQLKRAIKTNLRGWIEFMACDDSQCLPAKKQYFTVLLN